MNVRTRFAPSPTGMVHVGSLRTALYNFLFARKHGGSFILRIEDTDKTREVSGAVQNIIETLTGFGLRYDEGVTIQNGTIVDVGGKGPYIQSHRLDVYSKAALDLVAKKKAYYCFCSEETLESMRDAQRAAKKAPKYDKRCLKLPEDEVGKRLQAGEQAVLRLNIEGGREVAFTDMVRGDVSFNTNDIDDHVLLKSDGYPTYHLANVLDDHAMEITHVIRGEEWLPSTPKHLLIYEAFGWTPPVFAHIPLLLSPERKKLSKRDGDVAVSDFIAKGYLPEALLNFVALLGWNPGEGSEQEIFSLDELVQRFDMAHVHKAGAVFDMTKLNWINAHYIRTLSDADIMSRIDRAGIDEQLLLKIISVEKSRVTTLLDFRPAAELYVSLPEYPAELLVWKKSTAAAAVQHLTAMRALITDCADAEFTSVSTLTDHVLGWIKERGLANGDVLWPLRVALTGKEQSPSPFEVAFVLGKQETLDRISKALQKLS